MVRRIPSQVHKQAARLLRAKYIRDEPAWYQAVLAYPPIPLPSRAPPSRSEYDLPPSGGPRTAIQNRKYGSPQPLPIHYIEDDVRRQFFRDHPFESFRPVTLVEEGGVADEHPINGKEWTKLRQRGRNPSAEDAVKFTINLHKYHEIPLSGAYARAVAQFRALRGEHHIATTTAALEAEAYGAIFAPTAIEQGFAKEQKQIEAWHSKDELDAGAIAARKRWRAIIERQGTVGSGWSKGQEYVRLWKDGVRPTYAPSLTEVTMEEATPQEIAESADYMMTMKR